MRWDGVATRSMASICMLPRIGRIQSGDHAHQDGLAGAVGADIAGTASPAISRPCKRIEPAVGANVSDNMSDRISSMVNRSELASNWCRSTDPRRHPV